MTEPGRQPDVTVAKRTAHIQVSDELLAEAADSGDAINRWMTATPEQRAQWARHAQQQRSREREQAAPVPLTLDGLLTKLGFNRQYAEHLVQPYCSCWDGLDGWDACEHARDLGLTP